MNELNVIKKDWRNIDFSFGLIYPNIYKIGMSSYAFRLLYYMINTFENIACERIYLPEKIRHPAEEYPSQKIRSVENKVLLEDFDILGFTLQFENDYNNVLWILQNSLLPIKARYRQKEIVENNKRFPLIIAGGPVATSNPLPFSPLIDLFFIGDSEPNLEPFLKLYQCLNSNTIDFQEFLERASHIRGIYVPTHEKEVRRVVQKDLSISPLPIQQIISKNVNNSSGFEQNFFVEINRGCPFQCKFCISSFHNTPFRNRNYENIIEGIEKGINLSNFKTISLIGSCVSAHPRFYEICEYIINREKRLTIPSIRIEHITTDILNIFERGNIKTITIAPESGSERLRFSLDKKISNEKILSVMEMIKKSGIKSVKFYFLIGLPDETDEDINETISLMEDIIKLGFAKGALKVNINPLIPKLNTPYENKVTHLLEENKGKLKLKYKKIEMELKNYSAIKLKFQKIPNIIKNAKLQALISLGDLEMSKLLIKYYLEGADFGALRRAEDITGNKIDSYFNKIKNGYIPWKLII